MYESNEIQVSSLQGDWKTFVALNISQREKVILCYAIHDKAFLIDNWGVLVLTNERLLCRGFLIFCLSELKPDWLNQHLKDLSASERHRYEYNVSLTRIRQVTLEGNSVYVDFGAGIGEHGKLLELEVKFSTNEQAKKFHQELSKAIAESSVFPSTIEVKTSSDIADQLAKLSKLRNDGMISQEEFESAKRKLLS